MPRLVKDAGGTRIDATVIDDVYLLPASTWQHDPWLALANARRLVREGALQRAAEAYQHAQRLYEEPNYQQMCRSRIKWSQCGCPDIDLTDDAFRSSGSSIGARFSATLSGCRPTSAPFRVDRTGCSCASDARAGPQ